MCPSMLWAADRDGDGIADQTDQCPDVMEVYNEVADKDGCPDIAGIQIIGSLRGAEGQKSLSGRISIVGPDGASVLKADGQFEFVALKGGLFTVLAEVKGYRPQIHALLLTPGEALKLSLRFRR